jgi:hypothetical protein
MVDLNNLLKLDAKENSSFKRAIAFYNKCRSISIKFVKVVYAFSQVLSAQIANSVNIKS